jgi:predicted metal-dependent enzyme (double-stranded beta helix superfamily)
MASPFSLADLVRTMREVTARTSDVRVIVRELAEPARRFAETPACRAPEFRSADETQGFGLFFLNEELDHTLAVVVASLLPGRSLPAHNHRTWALAVGIDGSETNISWRRLDDGSRPGYAEIVETGRRIAGPGDILTFTPDDIHSVINETAAISLSLNLYGLSFAYTHASRFDPVARTESPLIPDAPPAA